MPNRKAGPQPQIHPQLQRNGMARLSLYNIREQIAHRRIHILWLPLSDSNAKVTG